MRKNDSELEKQGSREESGEDRKRVGWRRHSHEKETTSKDAWEWIVANTTLTCSKKTLLTNSESVSRRRNGMTTW